MLPRGHARAYLQGGGAHRRGSGRGLRWLDLQREGAGSTLPGSSLKPEGVQERTFSSFCLEALL